MKQRARLRLLPTEMAKSRRGGSVPSLPALRFDALSVNL